MDGDEAYIEVLENRYALVLIQVSSLFEAIAHGDEEHRAWLKRAISDHFAGKPVQPVRGTNNGRPTIRAGDGDPGTTL